MRKFEETWDRIDQLMDEGEAACLKAERVLKYVPADDNIVGELHALFTAAADEYQAAHRERASLDEILAAAIKTHAASLAWSRYVEAAADLVNVVPPAEMACRKLRDMGLIVDSGKRRKDRAGVSCVVWIAAPGLPANANAGDADLNRVFAFIRGRS
jgi:hypothetical protein